MKKEKTVILFRNPDDACKLCIILDGFLQREYPELTIQEIIADSESEDVVKYNVSTTPTLLVIEAESGKVLGRVNGLDFVKTREIIKLS